MGRNSTSACDPNRTPRRFGLVQISRLLQQRFQVENRGVLRDAGKSCPQSAIERMTLAGFPPTRVLGGTFLVTTEPAATTEFSPTVPPPMIVAPAAIHTFLSITMGLAIVKARRRDGSTGWPDVMMLTFGPIITSSAMSSPPRS